MLFMRLKMKKIMCVAILGIILLLMGCPARSLFPLFSEQELAFNPDLLGNWVDSDKEEYTFLKSSGGGYDVLVRSKDGSILLLSAKLGQLGGSWFLDSSPGEKNNDYHLMPAHVITRIWLKGDTLKTASLEGDYLRDAIAAGKLNVPHVQDGNDILLTASTKELQQLVLQLADVDAAFPDPSVLVRHK